jgi:hypothetical protein
MNINGRYISKSAILGYHWYRSSCLFRTYLCIDLINGKQIKILYEDGVGDKYNINSIKKILKFIKE